MGQRERERQPQADFAHPNAGFHLTTLRSEKR